MFNIFYNIHEIFSTFFYNSSKPQYTQPQSFFSTIWTVIIETTWAAWSNKISILQTTCIIATLTVIVYGLLSVIKQIKSISSTQTNTTSNTNTNSAPKVYNNTMNITVWLNQLDEYMDANKITHDQQKQQIIMQKLDTTSRAIINNLIRNNTIKSYSDLEQHLKNFFGQINASTNDHILEFTERIQFENESMYQFYKALTALATDAYPDTPKNILDKYVTKQFIKGLLNNTIKNELIMRQDNANNIDVLTQALQLQTKLANLSDTNNNHTIQHIHVKRTTQQSNTKDAQENSNANNDNNTTTCSSCKQKNHTSNSNPYQDNNQSTQQHNTVNDAHGRNSQNYRSNQYNNSQNNKSRNSYNQYNRNHNNPNQILSTQTN